MTDIFKTADITFSEPIDFSNVFGALSSGSSPSDATSEARSFEPRVALVTSGKPVVPDVGLSYVGKATKNDFSYRISVIPTLSRLKIANGRNVHSTFSFLSVGGVSITYQILDPTKDAFELPVLRLPMTFNVPLAIAGSRCC